jgi:hypothetical protein
MLKWSVAPQNRGVLLSSFWVIYFNKFHQLPNLL